MTLLTPRPLESTGPAARATSRDLASTALGLLRLARPKQWGKNALVLAAPAAAGILEVPAAVGTALVIVASFVAASVSIYAFNDVRDAEADRAHPRKRLRPVASGAVTPTTALVWSGTWAVLALASAAWVNWQSLLVVASYLLLSGWYALRLKHIAVLDIVVVASGFVLRELAGAVAVGVSVSSWFLMVSLFGALFLVSGKRAAERRSSGDGASATRAVLAHYPQAWLDQVMGVALTGTLVAYSMWAFQDLGTDVFQPLVAASVAPFLVALLRYGLLLHQGAGEAPELALSDRTVIVAGAVWMLCLGVGLYAA